MSNITGWRGLAFPFRFENGKPAVSNAVVEINDFSHIDESIKQILSTRKFSRPFSPNIGLSSNLIFQNFTEELLPYYESIILEAIQLGEKRISVDSVEGDISSIKKDGTVTFRIYWTLLKYNIPHVTESSIMIGGGQM